MMFKKSDKIVTEEDIFLKVAHKRQMPIEKVRAIYEAFLKGAKDKIEEEDKITFSLDSIGTLVMNKGETKYELLKRKVFTKEEDEIENKSDRSLKRRYKKLEEFTNNYVTEMRKNGNFQDPRFILPTIGHKAIHFYTSFKYHPTNFKAKNYVLTLRHIEDKIEEIFNNENRKDN